MSFIRWSATRALPLGIFGGSAAYLLAVSHSAPASVKLLLVGLLFVLIVSFLFSRISAHPAYAPGMLCVLTGILLYQSWEQYGPHAEATIIEGIVLAILFLTNIPRFETLLNP